MTEPNSPAEKQAIFLNVLDHMASHTKPSITYLCGNSDHQTGELLGTATFVSLEDNVYLVTADHVVHDSTLTDSEGNPLYGHGMSHSVGNNQPMMMVLSPWVRGGLPLDVAVTRINPIVLKGTEVAPSPVSLSFASDQQDLDDDVYFIHGWPGQRSRFTVFGGRGVMAKSLPYGGWLATSSWRGFDPEVHFAITYPTSELINTEGSSESLPHPGGLSGCTVWKTNSIRAGKEWKPSMARIVGVAHRYDQESQCLVASRIKYVRDMLDGFSGHSDSHADGGK